MHDVDMAQIQAFGQLHYNVFKTLVKLEVRGTRICSPSMTLVPRAHTRLKGAIDTALPH